MYNCTVCITSLPAVACKLQSQFAPVLCLGETISISYDMERQNFEVDGKSCSFMSMKKCKLHTPASWWCDVVLRCPLSRAVAMLLLLLQSRWRRCGNCGMSAFCKLTLSNWSHYLFVVFFSLWSSFPNTWIALQHPTYNNINSIYRLNLLSWLLVGCCVVVWNSLLRQRLSC